MGETAESLRERNPKISREDQDRFALESHRRAIAAIEAGTFASEIVAVPIPQKTGEPRLVSRDEPPRPDTSLEALGKLPPVFREGGTVTAGQSSCPTGRRRAGPVTTGPQAPRLRPRPAR